MGPSGLELTSTCVFQDVATPLCWLDTLTWSQSERPHDERLPVDSAQPAGR